jgi:hypothetical protein
MGKYIDSSKAYREYLIEMEKQQEDTPQPFKPDSIVSSIIDQFIERSKKGKAKYGVDLDRTDLDLLDWIEHAKQEHMDAILYLEKIKQEYIISGSQEKVI